MQKPNDTVSRVLVLDADMRHSLAVVRSLGSRGVKVDVAAHVADPISGSSKYVRQVAVYPDPLGQETEFCDWCEAQIASDEYELIIPITERTMVPMVNSRIAVRSGRFAMPSSESLEKVLDKQQTFELASKLGIPIPHSHTISSISDVYTLPTSLDYPLVLKPLRSVGERNGQRVQLRVEYANSDIELKDRLEQLLAYGKVIVQEYFQGDGVGIELIADNGVTQYLFQHKRLHELPLTGGGSTFRQSVPVNADLAFAAEKLIKALNWHGVAMVEFKHNPVSGEYRLMEINGRFWGSLPLAVAAGADFPLMLYNLYTHGAIGDWRPARVGTFCRRMDDDLLWYEAVLRHRRVSSLVNLPSPRSLIRDALLIFHPRHHFDVQQFNDFRPGLDDFVDIIRRYKKRLLSLCAERRLLSVQRRGWQRGVVQGRLKTAKKIVFVCYGNINRSSLAEVYYNSIVANGTCEVSSVGFHEEEGRPADPVMVDVAKRHGVELSGWRSSRISQTKLREADVIFVMEISHLQRIRNEYEGSYEKTYLLGLADNRSEHAGEIPDPYGRSSHIYEQCFDQVGMSVKAVVREMTHEI